ncbi:hypothetical protein TSOC_007686, partial [Tetrabaena socialis]
MGPPAMALHPWQQQLLAHWQQLLAVLPPSAWDASPAAERQSSASASTSAPALPACLLLCSDAAGGTSLARRAAGGAGCDGGSTSGRRAAPEWRTASGPAARRAPLLASLTASVTSAQTQRGGQLAPGAAGDEDGGAAAEGRQLSGTWIK